MPTAGDPQPAHASFDSLLHPLLDAAYGAALNLTRHRADAEDLVQDAALNAYRGFARFEHGSNFKAWFFRILYNAFLARRRGRRVEHGTVELSEATELSVMSLRADAPRPSAGADPAGEAIGRMQSAEVAAALQELPDDYRVVATMYFIEDFSYQAIADMLDIPVGTVRSRLHRGRKLLEQRLGQLAADHGIATSPVPERSDALTR
ncbi:MAG: sigma-70 family RNA polymerase sigma factor [Gemmatimonadaceae bacterium]